MYVIAFSKLGGIPVGFAYYNTAETLDDYTLISIPFDSPLVPCDSVNIIIGCGGVASHKTTELLVDDLTFDFVPQVRRETVVPVVGGDFEQAAPWSQASIRGCKRFLERTCALTDMVKGEGVTPKLEGAFHKTIKKVTQDIDTMKFKVNASTLKEATGLFQDSLSNQLWKTENQGRDIVSFVLGQPVQQPYYEPAQAPAPEAPAEAPAAPAEESWVCPACTGVNHSGKFCEYCGTPRP